MRLMVSLLFLSLMLSGCASSGQPEKEGDKAALSTDETGDTNDDSNNKEAASSSLSPSESMKLKKDRDGIVPVSIKIPAFKVNALIEKTGRMDNGEMGVPKGFDTVGWFEPGTIPCAPGNSVMAGHVDSKAGTAVFYKLKDLKTGDEVMVKDEDGYTMIFEATGKESYDRKNAPVDKMFDFSYTSKLNLITCTGTFNQEERTHEERLVVYTELKES